MSSEIASKNFPPGGVMHSNPINDPEPVISAHDTQKKADQFADMMKMSKALEEWEPKPFEPIWVWNNGSDKLRHKMLFAFASEQTIFAFDPQFEKWSNFEVHEWQNFSKIDDPILIPSDTIKSHFAKIYGVPADLIHFDK